MSSAFERSKAELASATMLTYLQADAPLAVTVDTPETAIGAVTK